MPEKAINKVVYGNQTLIDITDTTATTSDVLEGKYFYNAAGVKTLGTASFDAPEVIISSSGSVSLELQPGTIYHFTSESLTDLTITFALVTSESQYHFDFISPATAVTLSLPQTVLMPTNFSVEVNTKYEIDVVNNYGVFAEWVYEVSA